MTGKIRKSFSRELLEDNVITEAVIVSVGLVVLTDPTDNKQYIYAVGGYDGNTPLNTCLLYTSPSPRDS